MNESRSVVHFEDPFQNESEGRRVLGAKGWRLKQMYSLGLPVPPGFTLTTAVAERARDTGRLPKDVTDQLLVARKRLLRRVLEDPGVVRPSLLAVRAGAAESMPGVLLTVLNVGLSDESCDALAAFANDRCFAKLLQCRFVFRFAVDVLELPEASVPSAPEGGASIAEIEACLQKQSAVISQLSGKPFPNHPETQLVLAVEAALRSWFRPVARRYRKSEGIADRPGPAVTVQAMVFGNQDASSGAGVVFTRRPSDGTPRLYGEYLSGVQGDAVVSGGRTPEAIDMASSRPGRESYSLEALHPSVFDALRGVCSKLENQFGDLQDIEFTVERGRLSVLQSRDGKRTPRAAFRIAADLVNEGLISKELALTRVPVRHIHRLVQRRLEDREPTDNGDVVQLGRGLSASPGAASGSIVFSVEQARALRQRGSAAVLLRRDTSIEDIEGIKASAAVVTTSGGLTSHAAVVTRSFGIPCIVSAAGFQLDEDSGVLRPDRNEGSQTWLAAGDLVTVDGSKGVLYRGSLPLAASPVSPDVGQVLSWADELRETRVLVVVEEGAGVRAAACDGADGIVLRRPESLLTVEEASAILPAVHGSSPNDVAEAAAFFRGQSSGNCEAPSQAASQAWKMVCFSEQCPDRWSVALPLAEQDAHEAWQRLQLAAWFDEEAGSGTGAALSNCVLFSLVQDRPLSRHFSALRERSHGDGVSPRLGIWCRDLRRLDQAIGPKPEVLLVDAASLAEQGDRQQSSWDALQRLRESGSPSVVIGTHVVEGVDLESLQTRFCWDFVTSRPEQVAECRLALGVHRARSMLESEAAE